MVEPYIPDKETQWNMEKDPGCEYVEQGNREITLRYALNIGSTISRKLNGLCDILDIKSAFHHMTVSPNSISYLEFNFNNNNKAYRAIPFGTKHSTIFFAEAIESILRQIRKHSEIKILNYCDDIS
ncbi:MAG: hypothetical protein EZS28_044688, partial [Streblomastix strix]